MMSRRVLCRLETRFQRVICPNRGNPTRISRRVVCSQDSRLSETDAPSSVGSRASHTAPMQPPQNGQNYCRPHKDLQDLVMVPAIPSLAISVDKKKILQLSRPPPFPPISELARPEDKLAGLKIDGDAFSRSRGSYFTDISIVDIDQIVPAPDEMTQKIAGIPSGMWIDCVSYSIKGTRIAFTLRSPGGPNDPPRTASELWVADMDTFQARPILHGAPCQLNTIFQDYEWIDEDTIVACCLPKARREKPERPLAAMGPVIQENSDSKQAPAYTFQDLLTDAYDETLFEFYGSSELVVIDIPSGTVTKRSEPSLYTQSTNGRFLLVAWMERPFSYSVPCGRFPKRIQIWKRDLTFVKEIAYLPLADDILPDFNSVRKGPRSLRWRPDKDASCCWTVTQDGGDPKVEINPRDIVYQSDVDPDEIVSPPIVIATTALRFAGMSFCDDDLALLYETWWNSRRSVTTMIAPGNQELPNKVLFDRNYEDVYNDPGRPVTRRNENGKYILAKVDGQRKLLLSGVGASPKGNEPFLDILDVDSGEKERIWQSAPPFYESFSSLFEDVGSEITRSKLTVMLSRETAQDVRQFDQVTFSADSPPQKRCMTQFPHPYPHVIYRDGPLKPLRIHLAQMKDVKKEIIRYKRQDGVDLTATLYTPVGYDKEIDGPLPCIMWVYPRSFKSKDAAGQLRRSPYEFVSLGSMSPKLWLSRGYAIFDGPSMPIVGEEGEEPNDTYVDQLIANAEAAVEEVVRLGVARRDSIAVGGHSYGAFTVANLLAHCPGLFCCGICRSGAYNRTLTPFGFQAEQRTLWQAPETYMKMSPFAVADKIKNPILLIHGKDDNNMGTHTMQSERFYSALKAQGVACRLVLLPHEGHDYSAEESVLHCLEEMDAWLQKHCKKE